MFEYIKGNLTEIDAAKAIIDVNNIGYKIFIPPSVYNDLSSSINEEIKLYISFIVKEDSQKLYGFISKIQKDIFEMLISVSGVGAKTAVLLIGHLDVENLHIAVANADVRLISKVPGIGKKTAERLIIELRDKFKILDSKLFTQENKNHSSSASDAINALMSLGYNVMQAQRAVKEVLKDKSEKVELSNLITLALKAL
ncbi:MAG: Holliday junction ATP-dependent DNA helicase RuvA [Candidatus Anoxychlamydiales bacterium]|nr:Holliday junction ATP-dependent DNA helicase RuvA [Candidatus Anoxychlamydiales bacterium]